MLCCCLVFVYLGVVCEVFGGYLVYVFHSFFGFLYVKVTRATPMIIVKMILPIPYI